MTSARATDLDAATEIVCLLVGDKYPPVYVERLWRAVRAHCTRDLPLVCVTDRDAWSFGAAPPFELRRPPNAWPGWWQKINLFDRAFMPRRHVVFVDLDVVVLRSIDDVVGMAGRHELVHAEDPLDVLSSSLMIIDTHAPLAIDVVRRFDPAAWVNVDTGDQDYLRDFVGSGRYDVRTLAPADHYSYKCFVDHDGWTGLVTNPRYRRPAWDEIRTLNFHGFPKPHDLEREPSRWPYAARILPHWNGPRG